MLCVVRFILGRFDPALGNASCTVVKPDRCCVSGTVDIEDSLAAARPNAQCTEPIHANTCVFNPPPARCSLYLKVRLVRQPSVVRDLSLCRGPRGFLPWPVRRCFVIVAVNQGCQPRSRSAPSSGTSTVRCGLPVSISVVRNAVGVQESAVVVIRIYITSYPDNTIFIMTYCLLSAWCTPPLAARASCCTFIICREIVRDVIKHSPLPPPKSIVLPFFVQ